MGSEMCIRDSLVGEGGGSKRDKADSLGVGIISEDQLNSMLG